VSARVTGLLLAWLALFASDASAQSRWRDLVLTLGASAEGYSGNFSGVSTALPDSAERVTAAVGDVGLRGVVQAVGSEDRMVMVTFDGGVRQTSAFGFRSRDYAPREWVGSAGVRWAETLGGWGRGTLAGSVRARAVRDRTPMPLFLQPAYRTGQLVAGLETRAHDGWAVDAQADVEASDFAAEPFNRQLDLLDRRGKGVEVGLRWTGTSALRLYAGIRWSEYRNQQSFDPLDPFRRDRTLRSGIEWRYQGSIFAQVGLDGTMNRSNSRRPEYDALSVRALLQAPLPMETTLSLYGVVTGKSYLSTTAFARLVPGEEADNASIAYLELGRPFAPELDGALRLGWTRAETDIGAAYYRRFGASLRFNYRPFPLR